MEKKIKNWNQKDRPIGQLCVCGHTHISYVGDLGPDDDEAGWDRILECEECDCEEYRRAK